MSGNPNEGNDAQSISRRRFFATASLGITLTGLGGCAGPRFPLESRDEGSSGIAQPSAPYDSIRDYIAALERHGLVFRVDRVDQDEFEGTALMYRLVDRFGRFNAPVVIFENVKIDGQWIKGPVVANHLRHVHAETLLFGIDPVPGDMPATYRRAREHLDRMLESSNGQYPTIPPIEVAREDAACKQISVSGDAIDIRRYPFFHNNPGDIGRFINTTTVVTEDPEMGTNIGTYRCQITGPRTIIVGTGEGQTGFKMLMAAKGRGERTAPVALVCGQDPMTWLVSGSRIPERRGNKPVDEYAAAGGLRGRALDVVKCDTNELRVPAHAEMVIEGVVSLDEFKPNGPYGESPGYIGAVYEKAFPMQVTRITHRNDPWFINDFTGVTRPLIEMPGAALTTSGLQRIFPEITDYRWQDSVTFIRIKKSKPGQALDIGKRLAKLIPVFKIVMMVDDDVDLWNPADLFMAFSTRWQPHPASHLFEDLPANPLEPSAPIAERTSKIVIDATRQWPDEGGPSTYPQYSRQLLNTAKPDIFARVDEKWKSVFDAIERR